MVLNIVLICKCKTKNLPFDAREITRNILTKYIFLDIDLLLFL